MSNFKIKAKMQFSQQNLINSIEMGIYEVNKWFINIINIININIILIRKFKG